MDTGGGIIPRRPTWASCPCLSSYPQALVWGANPITLVSGGTIIWCLVVASTFWLAARAYGLEVAGWSILPLVFSSLGTIWLSGRITGGHLLTLVWHTVAFVGFHACLTRGGWRRAAALGLWCGLGLYLDAMFLITLAGLVPAAFLSWLWAGRSRAGLGLAAVFVAAMLVGLIPREIGRRVDPYDAYPSQFQMTLKRQAILEHGRILGLYCLPRLIAGTELTHLENAGVTIHTLGRQVITLRGPRMRSPCCREKRNGWRCYWWGLSWWRSSGWPGTRLRTADTPRTAVSLATLASALLVVGAFLVNRNIFNSDNYRYLIFLLTPWALGFGLWMNDLAKKSWAGRLVAWIIAGLLFEVMTSAAFLWYRDERLYVDQWGRPIRAQGPDWSELTVVKEVPHGLPADSKDFVVPSDVTHVFGGYWDVYRMAFLSGGRVTGIPFPSYPNRFRGWSRGLGPGRGKLLVLYPATASRKLGSRSAVDPGAGVVQSAQGTNWPSALATSWAQEERDPAELSRLRIVVP